MCAPFADMFTILPNMMVWRLKTCRTIGNVRDANNRNQNSIRRNFIMETINREKEIIKTSFIGIVGNVFLVVFKAFVGIIAGSVSIIMDAVNNFTDALSSIITIIGTKLSAKRADKKHPYGYGRIEYMTSTLIAVLILFAGGMAVYESIQSIIDHFQNGSMPSFETYSMIIIAVAIVVKVAIGLFFRKKGQKIESEALKASGMDALFDSILSTATLIGMIVAKFAGVYVEGYLGIFIGLFILKSGFGVMKESLSSMIGDRFEREYVVAIKEEINKIDGVCGCYDLILNSYGHNKNIGSVHIGVNESLTAKEIQVIERNISMLLYYKYNTIMTVGIYAENQSDEVSKKKLGSILDILKQYPTVLQIHGFYVDEEKKEISYDLVVSFDDSEPEETICKIKEETERLNEGYSVVVQYDQDFSLSE
ncbi:MAG: cation transporter [Ruminococcaceae bacterium]|nr:cation transporter [Oscillospiraceae bacterium]